MLKRGILVSLLAILLVGCQDGEIGTQPATVPGLFITWNLVSETVICPGEDAVVTEPDDVVLLTLRKNNYTMTSNGNTVSEGPANFDGNQIFFTPSPFPNNFLGAVAWVFSGRDLVLNSSETKAPGSLISCEVRRLYDF
jgi:hypothetical protein